MLTTEDTAVKHFDGVYVVIGVLVVRMNMVMSSIVPAFGAGTRTQATMAERQRTRTRVVSIPSTTSPFKMHRKLLPDDFRFSIWKAISTSPGTTGAKPERSLHL